MTDAPEKNSRSAIKHPASTYRQVRQMIVPARDAMGAARPAPPERVAGNVSWEEKLSAPTRERAQGEASCVNWQAALSSPSPSSDRVRAPRPARGAPSTIHRHTIAASTATRSATPPSMGTADGADKTFSSHPGGIADRARRVRLPAIDAFAGANRLSRFALANQATRLVGSSPDKERPGRTPAAILPSSALRSGVGIGQQSENGGDDDGGN